MIGAGLRGAGGRWPRSITNTLIGDCGKHVVHTYDGARDWVAYKFNQYGAHPAQGVARMGNTLPVDQGCKNIKVAGDGDYVWIDI